MTSNTPPHQSVQSPDPLYSVYIASLAPFASFAFSLNLTQEAQEMLDFELSKKRLLHLNTDIAGQSQGIVPTVLKIIVLSHQREL